jgi:predicted amino acid dehydrogenase
MDCPSASLDFAVIGHQDSWNNITAFVNCIRGMELESLPAEKIKYIFSFIPPRDLFRVKVKSKTGAEINGVYIDTFINPDKLDARFGRGNINKVTKAALHATKLGAKIVTLGGFTSIVLEGNLDQFSQGATKFTTGNTLTSAYIVKGMEQAALHKGINLKKSAVLVIGATGDIGTACVSYLKHKVSKLLLCARNIHRLENLSTELARENIDVEFSSNPDELVARADLIISVASSSNIELTRCKTDVLICDAGYPKNLETRVEDAASASLFHGGMGQVSEGYQFTPDYSAGIYTYPAPHVIHGCILEAMILAFEKKFENFSAGKGNIAVDRMEEIYNLSIKHGIHLSPFYNSKGLWSKTA